jgi:TonB family protein
MKQFMSLQTFRPMLCRSGRTFGFMRSVFFFLVWMSAVFNHAEAEPHQKLVSTDSCAMVGDSLVGSARPSGNLQQLTQEVRGRKEIRLVEIPKGVGEYSECQVPPSIETTLQPAYPEMARLAGIQGRVFVRVLIDEQGRAAKAEIVKRVPADTKVFDKATIDYIMSARFSPGQINGKKVSVWMTIPVRFLLQGKTISPEQGATQKEMVR